MMCKLRFTFRDIVLVPHPFTNQKVRARVIIETAKRRSEAGVEEQCIGVSLSDGTFCWVKEADAEYSVEPQGEDEQQPICIGDIVAVQWRVGQTRMGVVTDTFKREIDTFTCSRLAVVDFQDGSNPVYCFEQELTLVERG